MVKAINDLKCDRIIDAKDRAISIHDSNKKQIGRLLPVGLWILQDSTIIESICTWRQRAMKMFLTQFQATYESTFKYLCESAIERSDRILFLIFDEADNLIGHIGLADIGNHSCELDNLMRGRDGGHPRLIFYAERALLDWVFDVLNLSKSYLGVLSYNWLVINLHKEVGYEVISEIPLKKIENNGFINHDLVSGELSNVKYKYIKMGISSAKFYQQINSNII